MCPALTTGVAAFALMILYDWIEAYRKRHIPVLFFAGAALLVFATVWIALLSDLSAAFLKGPARFCIGACGALASAAVTACMLFVSLPFADTYEKAGEKQCVSSGWYALCRHPAALTIYFVYGFLLLMAPSLPALLAFAVFPNLNLLYVALEDRYFFPKTIEGYESYKKQTPFLIPSRASVKRMRG